LKSPVTLAFFADCRFVLHFRTYFFDPSYRSKRAEHDGAIGLRVNVAVTKLSKVRRWKVDFRLANPVDFFFSLNSHRRYERYNFTSVTRNSRRVFSAFSYTSRDAEHAEIIGFRFWTPVRKL